MAKGYYSRGIDWPFVCVMGFLALAVSFLIAFAAWAINDSDKQEAAFKARCDAAHGQVMETRYTDFCLNGNTILFMSN